MNMLKRSFAMLLALCMLVSAVPVNAIAAEATDLTEPIVLETDAPEVTEAPIESETPTESEVPTESEIPTEGETIGEEETPTEGVTVPEEETPTEGVTVPEEEDPTEGVTIPEEETPTEGVTIPEEETVPEETEEFFEIGWVSEEAISGVKTYNKPEDGTTEDEPFPKGTGGSNSFRIPALVTLSNGNLVAAADARWNTTYDGGGLDTIVSRSSDNGANWSYTFANYLGDNDNEYNGSGSTAFIDPALAVSGNTVYMLCDLYPYGIALNGSGNTAPSTAVGFNSEDKLLLSTDGSNYNYYLDGETIRSSDGTAVSGYTVDEYFNITGTGVDSNLFFSDSPFKVVRTGFLYLTKSTDGGKTWSAPELLDLKTTSEQVCLVGPGRGLVTDSGMIVFPVYSYNGSQSSQMTGFIYSTDGGSSWNRSANFTGASWSSESAVVELEDGTLRFFYRNGTTNLCYVDYKNVWGTPVVMNGTNGTECIDTNSNCQISAITYSKTIDDKQVILVSCPTGPSEAGSDQSGASYRLNGKIFAFTVESDGSMTKVGSVDVTSGGAQFMYSCMTELTDGTIGILYEDCENDWGYADHDNDGLEAYYTMEYDEFDLTTAMSLTFDSAASGDEDENVTNTVNVRIPVGGTSETYTVNDVYVTNLSDLNTGVASATLGGQQGSEATVEYTAATVTCGNLLNSDKTYQATDYYVKADDGNYYPLYVSRASYSSARTYYYYTYYYSTDGGTTYTQCGTQNSLTSVNTNANITVYTKSGTEAVPVCTTVAFNGVAAGTTSTVIGTTRFNIEVYAPRNITVTYQLNGVAVASEYMAVESDAKTVTLPSVVMGSSGTAYSVSNTTLTLEDGKALYTVAVTELAALSATVAEGASATLTLEHTLTDGQYVVWTTADSSYVAVGGNYDSDGGYTNSATIIGNGVSSDGVLVSGTVYNADGTVAYASNWLVTVTEGTGNTNTTSKYIYINITRIQNTTVYYNINGGELIQITDDMLEGPYTDSKGTYYKLKVPLMDEQYTGGFQISFFADPDEGYALTYMSSTNSAGDYYTLSDGNADGVGSDAWPFADGYDYEKFDSLTTKPGGNDTSVFNTSKGIRWGLAEGSFTVAQMKVMFANAISKGCDGILVFTKNGTGTTNGSTNNSNDLVTDLAFVSQKLPEMDKEIATVNGAAYTPGTVLKLGDRIVYNVYVYEPEQITDFGTITYSNIDLKDPLTNNSWTSKSSNSTTGTYTFTNSATGEEITMTAARYTYTTNTLTLAVTNLLELVDEQGHITNTATLKYDYSSQYSTGTLSSSADAVVSAKVEVPEYVIDFGLPVQFNLTNNPLIEGYETIVKATAQYGSVTFDGLTVTYTPTQILQGADFIRLTIADNVGSTNNIGYGIRIYPATTVFYEESFVTWGSNWSGGNSQITVDAQTTEQLNVNTESAATQDQGKQYNYGYDPAYDTATGASNETDATTANIGAKGDFTFTGTGFDLYGNCTENTGCVSVRVRNTEGKLVKVYMVDTLVKGGTTDATTGQTGDEFHLPIVSVNNLDHGTYTVSIVKISDEEAVNIDGVRVFNTMPDSTIFTSDLEDNPEFYELRNMVLNAIGVSADTSVDYKEMVSQVYDAAAGASALITDESVTYGSEETIQDLLDNGPKNELFLYAGQTLTFNVKTDRAMQIGLKAPRNATAYTLKYDSTTVASNKALNTSVDMFYELDNPIGTERTYTVSVTNTGSDILSVTDLKICDDPNAAFVPLTVDDIEYILTQAGVGGQEPAPEEPTDPEEPIVPEEPEVPVIEYADAVLKINLVDYTGKQLAAAELTANGIKGEENAFAGAAVLRMAERNLPKGYALVSKQADAVKVAYGEETTVSVQIGKVATVKVTFVNLLGRKVGTATITKVQTSAAPCRITAAEIRSLAPVGRLVIRLTSVTAAFGSTTNVIVPVV